MKATFTNEAFKVKAPIPTSVHKQSINETSIVKVTEGNNNEDVPGRQNHPQRPYN